jgi:hypothetical protein
VTLLRSEPTVHAAISSKRMKPPAVVVREACFDDYSEVADLQARYELDPGSYEEWTHLWVNNPAYRGRDRWPIGWVLETANKEIVGYIGNIPLVYELLGRTLLAATGRGFVVDAQYRAHSFMLLDRYFRQSGVDLHLNTTVNVQAISAYGVFRALKVPVGEWDQSAFWITNHRGFAQSLLRSRSVPCANLLSLPTALASRTRDFLLSKNLPEGCAEVKYCSSFDGRFDAFWEALRTSSRQLLAARDRKTLEWHFKHPMLHDRVWLMTVEKNGQLEAYAIFCRDDSRKFDLKRMRLIDFQALNGGNGLLPSLLAEALQRCRAEGIHMLEVIGFGNEKRNVLRGLIPYKRQLPSWMYFYRTKDGELVRLLKSAEVWDPCGFDGDSSF